MAIAIVTDSGSDLPPAVASELGIVVVPLTVRFGDEELVDWRDLGPAEFWTRCEQSPVLPETAAPSTGAFQAAFQEAADRGHHGVVCVTMSSSLSATYESARAAARALERTVPVRVVDSRSITMGEGLMAMTAAAMARVGKDAEEVVGAMEDLTHRTFVYGALATLDNLRKGGRIGAAAAVFGSLLSFKPIITVVDGAVEAESRQRTRSRSLQYLVDKLRQAGPVDRLAVIHGNAPDVDELVGLVKKATPGLEPVVADLGPVIGTHGGPGAVGLAFQRAGGRGGA
ncbi:MAG: DegV family protein [Acidimicrobiales bacterium]